MFHHKNYFDCLMTFENSNQQQNRVRKKKLLKAD